MVKLARAHAPRIGLGFRVLAVRVVGSVLGGKRHFGSVLVLSCWCPAGSPSFRAPGAQASTARRSWVWFRV